MTSILSWFLSEKGKKGKINKTFHLYYFYEKLFRSEEKYKWILSLNFFPSNHIYFEAKISEVILTCEPPKLKGVCPTKCAIAIGMVPRQWFLKPLSTCVLSPT